MAAAPAAGGLHALDFFRSVFVVRCDNAVFPLSWPAPSSKLGAQKMVSKTVLYVWTMPETDRRHKRGGKDFFQKRRDRAEHCQPASG
jgi:hypothetical protein